MSMAEAISDLLAGEVYERDGKTFVLNTTDPTEFGQFVVEVRAMDDAETLIESYTITVSLPVIAE